MGGSRCPGERGSKPLKPLDMDLNHIPDAAMTAACCALRRRAQPAAQYCELAVKETDRLAAMATELRKLGASVEGAPTTFG